jgi:hypothetical protein
VERRKFMKISILFFALDLLFCSPEESKIPDLSNAKWGEIDYYNNGADKAPEIFSDTLGYYMETFRQLSKAVPGHRLNRIFNGKIKYFNYQNALLCEGEFSIDTNDDLQLFKISHPNQRNASYFAIPEDILSLIELMNPKNHNNDYSSKYYNYRRYHSSRGLFSMPNPLKHHVPKIDGFYNPFRHNPTNYYRIRVIKWAHPKDKLFKNDKIAIKYIAIDSSYACQWEHSIDSIISEQRMLNNDTGTTEVALQMSTARATDNIYGDTSRIWESNYVISISFLNGDFTAGYWDYYKVYFNAAFANMIKAKGIKSGLLVD